MRRECHRFLIRRAFDQVAVGERASANRQEGDGIATMLRCAHGTGGRQRCISIPLPPPIRARQPLEQAHPELSGSPNDRGVLVRERASPGCGTSAWRFALQHGKEVPHDQDGYPTFGRGCGYLGGCPDVIIPSSKRGNAPLRAVSTTTSSSGSLHRRRAPLAGMISARPHRNSASGPDRMP